MTKKTAKLAGGAVASITALVLAGCGDSSSHTTTGTVTQQARQVTIASPDVGAAPAQATAHAKAHAGKQAPAASAGRRDKQAARYPSGPDDENNGTGAKPLDPCKLVSSSEVQGIAQHPVAGQINAPLGPTCIYKLRGAQSDITLAVESAGFKQLVRQMKKSQRVSIRGRTGYCGQLGKPTLYLSLGAGRVLSVSASCRLTVPIADTALGRLGA